MTPFERIYRVVRQIPSGYVASYGQVAQAAGFWRGARLVGWALRALPPQSDVPWQRVVNRNAEISIINPRIPAQLQRELLEAEGIAVSEEAGCLRIGEPRWYAFAPPAEGA